eukprot:m.10409 g.10409  ORF g.10409 m.10409 type:complete len:88 (-) comp7402_c0_seq1:63-326(-)
MTSPTTRISDSCSATSSTGGDTFTITSLIGLSKSRSQDNAHKPKSATTMMTTVVGILQKESDERLKFIEPIPLKESFFLSFVLTSKT